MKLSDSQPELINGHLILRFKRAGLDNLRLAQAIERHVKDETAVLEIIEAARAWNTALVQVRGKRGPFGMKAGAKKRPNPFIKVGDTKIMLPRFYK
jgi:hypothetical protein